MAFGIFFQYAGPLLIACFFYSQIVSAVFAHERALREQAKKMNVESLRQGDAVSVWLIGKNDCDFSLIIENNIL